MWEESDMGEALVTGAARRLHLLQAVIIKSGVFWVYFPVPRDESEWKHQNWWLVECNLDSECFKSVSVHAIYRTKLQTVSKVLESWMRGLDWIWTKKWILWLIVLDILPDTVV